jgi:hypothetical protein
MKKIMPYLIIAAVALVAVFAYNKFLQPMAPTILPVI